MENLEPVVGSGACRRLPSTVDQFVTQFVTWRFHITLNVGESEMGGSRYRQVIVDLV